MNTLIRFIALGCLLLLAACATTTGSNQAPPFNPNAQEVEAYHIGVDDQVQVLREGVGSIEGIFED